LLPLFPSVDKSAKNYVVVFKPETGIHRVLLDFRPVVCPRAARAMKSRARSRTARPSR
jgi:hypothetical protein